jgi:phenylalanyl-tRNA synthetase beta chain
MKFTLSWLKEHLNTNASVAEVVDAMTMAGLEVEGVEDPASKLAKFTVAKVVEAVQHPNADKLRVCQVDTVDGRLEIVCGAANARAGLTTIYAPIGAFVPGSGITLEARPCAAWCPTACSAPAASWRWPRTPRASSSCRTASRWEPPRPRPSVWRP